MAAGNQGSDTPEDKLELFTPVYCPQQKRGHVGGGNLNKIYLALVSRNLLISLPKSIQGLHSTEGMNHS